MSNVALNWAFAVQQLNGKRITPTQKLILIALADKADEEHSCFPGQETLATLVGVSVRAIRDQLKLLEEGGLLRRVRRPSMTRGRMTDRYYLPVQPEAYVPVEQDDQPADFGTTNRQNMAINRQTVAGTKNPQLEPSEEPKDIYTDPELEQAFELVWSAWPKKADRKDAYAKFRSTIRRHFSGDRERLVDSMLAHAKAYRQFRPDTNFVPAMSVWLNKQRWNEKPITGPVQQPGQSRAAAMLERYGVAPLTDADFQALG